MLDATDRDEVLAWSERQLGPQAKLISVLQMDENAHPDCVEKSGTGVRQALTSGCEAKLSFMADSVHRVAGLGSEKLQAFEWYRTADMRSCNSSVH